jgi:zinc transport system substrate-binding protein
MIRVPVFLFMLLATVVDASPLRIGVSILPLEPIVREIAGDGAQVQSLQREGDSCSVFEPRPSAIAWLAGAEVFFRTGVGYESAIIGKISSQFPALRVADLRDTVQLLHYGEAHHHHHAGDGCTACASHAGQAADPHIWLDPLRLASMADFIAEQLAHVRPEQAGEFRARASALKDRCRKTHAILSAMLSSFEGRAFYIYHPALNYFADRYGLRQVAIAGASQAPSPRELHRIIEQAREDGVRTIFVQPQESHKHARIVADAVGADVVEIDPMGMDWEANLMQIGSALAGSMQDAG